MRRHTASATTRGSSIGVILLAFALGACTADTGDHPRTVGLPYEDALRIIRQWCPNADVRVVPPDVPQAVADHSVLLVHAESYRIPDQATQPPVIKKLGAPIAGAAVAPRVLGAARIPAHGQEPAAAGVPAPTEVSSPARPDVQPCDTSVTNTVTLRLATRVPNLSDLSVGDARALLERQGLGLRVLPEAATDTAVVRAQSPAEGTAIEIDAVPRASVPVTVEAAVRIPDVVGLPDIQACRSLAGLGLDCEVLPPAGDDPVPGKVTSQEPAPGGLAEPGAAVRLTVVRDQILVTVPDVLGQTEAQACERLREIGLDCRVDGPADSALAAEVAMQVPAAGEQVPLESVVAITLAVHVPDVVDLDAAAACTALGNAGLACRPVDTTGAGRPGFVARQDPPARAVVPLGTRVTVESPRGARVPDVRDAAGDVACDRIVAAGLTCKPDNRASGGERGVVVGQSPEPGTLVADGTEVTLVVQQEPATGVPLWTVIVAAVLVVAAATGVQQYRRRHPPGPPSVEVSLRPGAGRARLHEAREW